MNRKSIKKFCRAPKNLAESVKTVFEIAINNFRITVKKLLFVMFALLFISCSNNSKNSENTIKVWHIQNLDSQAAIKEKAGQRFKS